jgi:hypothetical protein
MKTEHFDIFISYSIGCKLEALKLYRILRLNELRVWLDLVELSQFDKSFIKEREYIALKYASVFICLVNKTYSSTLYCVEELKYAFKQNKSIISLITERCHLYELGYAGFLLQMTQKCDLSRDVDDFLDTAKGETYEQFFNFLLKSYSSKVRLYFKCSTHFIS